MLIAKRICGCQAHEYFERAEDYERSAVAESDQVLKDERSDGHAEEFRECGEAGDLPLGAWDPERWQYWDINGWVASKPTDNAAFDDDGK